MTYGAQSIYLDHAATTPVDPAVVAAMMPFFTATFGNPSSIYQAGQDGRAALDRSRAGVARVLGSRSAEIVFTSGATESNNLAVKGVAAAALDRIRTSSVGLPHIITSTTEHHAVLHPVRALEQQGYPVTYLPVNSDGFVSATDLAEAIRPDTCLVSIIYANNEIGTVQPVAALAEVTRRRGVLLHVDAVQAAGSLPLNVDE
nr:aminotransferase class V-fold PLP-dependent enzyme [Chloroflexia bacterium]